MLEPEFAAATVHLSVHPSGLAAQLAIAHRPGCCREPGIPPSLEIRSTSLNGKDYNEASNSARPSSPGSTDLSVPVMQRQLCWAHLIRDLSAIAERQGVSGEFGLELLALQQQLFVQWPQ